VVCQKFPDHTTPAFGTPPPAEEGSLPLQAIETNSVRAESLLVAQRCDFENVSPLNNVLSLCF
jgi:hypothetical protein